MAGLQDLRFWRKFTVALNCFRPEKAKCRIENDFFGRAGTQPGIRELVIGGTPYVVLYRVSGQRVIIRPTCHPAQKRESCDSATRRGAASVARPQRLKGAKLLSPGRKAW